MKKVKDSRKRWKQLVTMLLVTALLVTGTPDIVGLASEGTQEQVTTAADQSEGTQAEGQAEAAQEEEAISEEPVEQQDTSVQQDTAAKQENTEKNIENRSTAGTTERSENSQNSHEKDKAASGAKSGGSSTSKVRETEKNTKKEDKDTKTEYTYRGSAIQAKVTLKDAEDLSDEADLRVKQTTVANKIKTQIINKAVGEENTQLVDSARAYDLSFILNGKSVDPSGSMQVTLANLGTKSGQNTLIYQVTDDGQVKNTDAVRTGSDAMQFAAKSLCTYVVLTYTTVSDVNGNDITTLYPAMVTAAQTQLESKEDGNVPVESWTRTNTPLVLKDTTGKKALAWTWSDIAGIDLSLDNDSQIWNGSRSYGKHTSTSLKNGRVTAKSGKLYDSALWKNEGKAGKDTTITRIRGEFTITDKNKNNYAYTLKPVTDSENIYAKDNMFVFVYPKDVELTDDNYMDYLAFWTGSLADAGEKERTFHGRTASNYTQRTPVENVSVLTDGWHMTAACNNAGSIITSTDASDYYVDVISTTDSSNGGMYRFKLVKEKKEKTQFTFRNLDTNAKTGKGGAVFELYKDGVHYSAQSENEEGRVTFNIVKPEGSDTDVYTLKETKAPEGYDKITTTWKVLVSSEGVTMVKDTEGNEMPKYPDGTYVVSSAKTDEADSTEQTAKTPSVIREYKSDGQTPIANNIIVNQTPKEIIQSSMDYSKTAKVNNWDQRTYDITINASSKVSSTTITTKKPVVDIMLVLDVSGSMGENIETYDHVAMNTPSGRNSLDPNKKYYLEVNDEYKEMSYSWRNGKWDWYVGRRLASSYGVDCKIYEKKVGTTKLDALKDSVNQFIDDTKANSPNSKIGITAFSSVDKYEHPYGDHGKSKELMQVGVGENADTLKSFVNNLDAEGGTDPAVGLNNAQKALVNAHDENPKYVILFTDGEPTGRGSDWDTTAQKNAETSAKALKDARYTVYTIGFGLDERPKTFLAGGKYGGKTYPGIASTGCAKEANDAASLNAIFKEIQSEVTNNSDITGATITDVIDPRFVVVKGFKDDGTAITITNEELKKEKTIELNNGGVVSLDANGNQVVTWTDQTIPNKNNKEGKKNWSNTITVKAKDEYIGGNDIPTNISPDSKITTEYGEAILPQPKVNVKADLLVNNTERTIFLDENTPYSPDLLKELFDEDNPLGYVDMDGNLKPYTMGSDGNAFKPEDFSIQWYSDENCTNKLTSDQIRADQPKSTKEYYLKVTYNEIGQASEESNKNTTGHSNDEKISAHNSADDKADKPRTYGVYKVNVKTGTIDITKKLLSDIDYVTSNNASFNFIVEKIKDADGKDISPGENIGQYSISFDVKDGKVIAQKLTKKEGSADLTKLPKGMYTVTEDLSSETKYEFKDGKILSNGTTCDSDLSTDHKIATFAIGYKNYNTAGDGEGLDNDQGKVIFTNQRLSSIQINKIGEKDEEGKDKPLQGARFEIAKKDKDNKYVKVQNVGTNEKGNKVDYIVTGASGKASFNDLPEGNYQITEIQSPAGYTLLANPIEVSLPYVVTDSSKIDIVPIDSKKVNYGDADHYYEITYTIKNNKLFNMPASGGRFKATLIGIAVMIMAAGCYILRHRRKRII
ncbi:VWA domain-containing protein [Anaerobutyricum soehngenii]|uniref:VWA domain-containing protein n=1 Tax=Anaerobutyricum soehngenii TaxID=105843 RepID=A0A6N7XY06_9FIRM|nr:SpaA isopeptide-forming pilin-related protein [Anaerobutyricum soehngenii]MSU81711.1 VWA domain-containing protein [Anaerobutyricum soehngenii]